MSRPGFGKRQKELARKEKQRAKAERKLQRKLQKDAGVVSPEFDALDALDALDAAEPQHPAAEPGSEEPETAS